MDIQLKRGILDVCVLAAIKNEDSYGYKIIKDLKPYIELSESTLYTILKRLELANMLTVKTTMIKRGHIYKWHEGLEDERFVLTVFSGIPSSFAISDCFCSL